MGMKISVNGAVVHVWESQSVQPGRWGLNVAGSFWGYFDSADIAMRAAVAVLTAPLFN